MNVENAVLRLVAVFALVFAAASAQAATVIAFDRALPGQPFTISNPQTTTVTGTVRVHPRLTGPNSTKALAFTLAAGERKTFADILQNLAETKPSIIRIESSDLIGETLRPATPGQSVSSPLNYSPGGADPTILVPALAGTVNVKIFATREFSTAIYSETFTLNGAEGTIVLQPSAILRTPDGTPIRAPDGIVVVEAVTGAAAVTTTYVPSRVRSVRHSGLDPMHYSIQTPGCAGGRGAFASVTVPRAGMQYSWSVLNGAPEGSTSDALFPFTLGQKGYSFLHLGAVHLGDGASTSTDAILRVDDVATVTDVWASDGVDNQFSRVHWALSGAATVTLYGTDFPSRGVQVDAAKSFHDFRVSGSGSHWVEVVASNACGTTSKRSSFTVVPPTPSGSITAPPICSFNFNLTPCALTVVVENVPSDVQWRLRSAIGNGFNHPTGSGSGTFTRHYVVGSEPGPDTITNEVDGVAFASTPILVVAGDIGANPSTVLFGQTSTLTIIIEYLPAGKTWKLRSAKGNLFQAASGGDTGMGSGTFTRTYQASTSSGEDTITVEVDGVVIVSIPIRVN